MSPAKLLLSFNFLAPYLVSLLVLISLVVFVIVPLLRKFRVSSCKKLRYAQWLYLDEEPNGRYNGKIRLSDTVANYALDRYPKECKEVQPWHVFVRTNAGTPLAVAFNRDTYIIESTRRLYHNEVSGKRLRAIAKCSNSPIVSQFENDTATNDSKESRLLRAQQRALRRLAKRYRYEIRFEDHQEKEKGEEEAEQEEENKSVNNNKETTTEQRNNSGGGNDRYVVFEFTDVSSGNKYKFTVDSLRPTFVDNRDNGVVRSFNNRLPDEWLLSRKSTARPISFDNGAINDATVANLTSGVRSYERSPCFDPSLGKQTVGRRAIASLRDFENLYMRGIVVYPDEQELKDKLKRFYWDCVYDTTVDKDFLVDDSLNLELFPIVTYLRICPNDRPIFDKNLSKCV